MNYVEHLNPKHNACVDILHVSETQTFYSWSNEPGHLWRPASDPAASHRSTSGMGLLVVRCECVHAQKLLHSHTVNPPLHIHTYKRHFPKMPTSAMSNCFSTTALFWPVTSFFNIVKCEQISKGVGLNQQLPPYLSSFSFHLLPSSPFFRHGSVRQCLSPVWLTHLAGNQMWSNRISTGSLSRTNFPQTAVR